MGNEKKIESHRETREHHTETEPAADGRNPSAPPAQPIHGNQPAPVPGQPTAASRAVPGAPVVPPGQSVPVAPVQTPEHAVPAPDPKGPAINAGVDPTPGPDGLRSASQFHGGADATNPARPAKP